MKLGRTAFALTAVTVYIVCPAYRYYIIGSWIGYKILNEKQRFQTVRKDSKTYKRLVAAKV